MWRGGDARRTIQGMAVMNSEPLAFLRRGH